VIDVHDPQGVDLDDVDLAWDRVGQLLDEATSLLGLLLGQATGCDVVDVAHDLIGGAVLAGDGPAFVFEPDHGAVSAAEAVLARPPGRWRVEDDDLRAVLLGHA